MDQGVLIRQLQGVAKRALPFAAGWGNFGGIYEGASYSRMGRLVVLQGLVTKTGGTPTSGNVIGTLPLGFRPTSSHVFVAWTGESGQAGRVDVHYTGEIQWVSGGTAETDFLTLSGIAFVVD